jgi:hypothetical protein
MTGIASFGTTTISGSGGYADIKMGNQSGLFHIWTSSSHRALYDVYSYSTGAWSIQEIWAIGTGNFTWTHTGVDRQMRFTNNGSSTVWVKGCFIGSSPAAVQVVSVT